MKIVLPSLSDTQAMASAMAQALKEPCVIALYGTLGAGKTTWVRAVLRALGHEGAVPSPTYTLVEPYRVSGFDIYHVDLYRMQEEGEFDFLGLREHLDGRALMLIEWPQRCPELERCADLALTLEPTAQEGSRQLHLEVKSERGEALLARWIPLLK